MISLHFYPSVFGIGLSGEHLWKRFWMCLRNWQNGSADRSWDFSPISSRIQNLKTRQYTYTRISRSLFHILLDMTEADACTQKRRMDMYPMSGFLVSVGNPPHYWEQSKASALPLITKTTDASKMLSEHAFFRFSKDLYCSHLYQAVYQAKTGQALPNEYTHSVIIR